MRNRHQCSQHHIRILDSTASLARKTWKESEGALNPAEEGGEGEAEARRSSQEDGRTHNEEGRGRERTGGEHKAGERKGGGWEVGKAMVGGGETLRGGVGLGGGGQDDNVSPMSERAARIRRRGEKS